MENEGEKNLKIIENKEKPKEKKIYIELLRCIAIFFVIFNHTSLSGFELYTVAENGITYTIYLAMSIICKMAVPVFFMISGALLLGKEESIKTLYKKRVLKIFIVTFVASLFIFIVAMQKANQLGILFNADTISTFLKKIYTEPIVATYWFLYLYLAFLIMLPLLRNLVKNMKKETYYYLFIVYAVYKLILPIIEQRFNISLYENSTIYFLEINILCPIIGYYCEHVLDIKKISKKAKILGTILVICVIICAGILTTLELQKIEDANPGTYIQYGDIAIASYVFILIKYIFSDKKLPKLITKVILTIGSCSFGIYLIESILRHIMLESILETLSPIIKVMPACIIAILCIIFVGTLITLVLKKIPYIKKLL